MKIKDLKTLISDFEKEYPKAENLDIVFASDEEGNDYAPEAVIIMDILSKKKRAIFFPDGETFTD